MESLTIPSEIYTYKTTSLESVNKLLLILFIIVKSISM